MSFSDVDICVNIDHKCDGDRHCNNFSDEFVSECPECVDDPSKLTCKVDGQMVCLGKYGHQCNGAVPVCDDSSDQDPATCNNCTLPSLFGDRAMCRDGGTCFLTTFRCNGRIACSDGSDESDSYSHCKFCTEEGSLPCPGFPGNCGKLCDGKATCPDKWDELLSVCKSHSDTDQSNGSDDAICSEEDGLYQCRESLEMDL